MNKFLYKSWKYVLIVMKYVTAYGIGVVVGDTFNRIISEIDKNDKENT